MKPTWLLLAVIAAAPGNAGADQQTAWQAFLEVATVLQSPRCVNCHIPGDAPLQGDAGRRHNMSIRRGSEGRGTPAQACSNCHQDENSVQPHAPPGAADWRLPPAATPMAWIGLSASELCVRLKDPAQNGGRDLAALKEHVSHDHLVSWGFSPGPGRKPPPLPQDVFVARFAEWLEAGAPCAGKTGKAGKTGQTGKKTTNGR